MSTTLGAFTAGSSGHSVISLWDVLRASHGQEHRNLVMSQMKIVEPTNGSPSYISYTENVSENHSGGLAQRKVEPKQVIHYQNLANPSRCLVRLMKLYLSHCPEPQPQIFYLAPLTKPKSDVWYSSNSVGHNTLGNTVKSLRK